MSRRSSGAPASAMTFARCAGAADVMAAVRFAREHGLHPSMRGGGHNVAGSAVSDGGLMIDLSPMKSVRVDPASRTARAEPGVLWQEFVRETEAFGLATPGGVVGTTGIAGLTLGGGQGWLAGKYGLTIDNLLSADVVLADGSLVRASTDENPDLFWALRGAGANFGVVTSFEYRLHPVGPHLSHGSYVNDLDRDDGEDRVRAAYGANYDRLVELKTTYDPTNLFRMNNNIKPARPA